MSPLKNLRLERLIEYKRRKGAFQGGPFYLNQGLPKISNGKCKFAKSWGTELNAAVTSVNTENGKETSPEHTLFGHRSLC